jgi:Zn-dependent peptidase ImmA (M78 family)
MPTNTSRIEHLEAFAQTILLAIDQLRQRQENFQQDLQSSREEFDRRLNASAEQIAANTAGLVELRGILADYLRSRTTLERQDG